MITTLTEPLTKIELQMGVEHIKSMLKTKPCDDFIIIKHDYRVGSYLYFDYDLFKFAYPDSDSRQIERLECSYFLEQLLTWFGHSHATQQKKVKIKLWEAITGETLYSSETLQDSTVTLDKFFSIVGFFIYGNIRRYVAPTITAENKQDKLALFAALGEECFFLIADYLNVKYGEIYDKKGILPAPTMERKYSRSILSTTRDKFDKFLATDPKITAEKQKEGFNYSVFAFITDFESSHNATFTWAADFLLLELLLVAGNTRCRTVLNDLKAKVRTPRGTTITETEFYQLFGCCVLFITKEVKQEFKLCDLRRLGKACFLKLVEYLEVKE